MSNEPIESKYTLLIYEIIPEETKLFLLPPEVATAHEVILQEAQNKFANTMNAVPACQLLADLIAEEFAQYQVQSEAPIIDKTITAIYFSGYLL